MAKKYIIYEVEDNDGGSGGGDDWGTGLLTVLIIIALFALYQFLFGDYNDSDFKNAKYFNKAKAGAEELVLEWQGRNWRPRGFTDEFQVFSNEPEFKCTIVHFEDHSPATYLGNGIFEVIVETDTILKSKNNDTANVREGFVVQIQSNPSHGFLYRTIKGDDWKIITAEQYYMTPTLPEINDLIAQWSSSKKWRRVENNRGGIMIYEPDIAEDK